jgi:peptidyl-prolyl cis-trans isomerase C
VNDDETPAPPGPDEPAATGEPPAGKPPAGEPTETPATETPATETAAVRTPAPGEPDTVAQARRRALRGRRVVAVIVVVAVVAGLAAVARAALKNDCPPGGAALEARGRTVSVDELERRTEVLKALYGLEPPAKSDRKRADAFPRDLAKSVAVALIVQAEVDDRGLQAADKAVRDALDRYVAERFPEGGRTRFIESLGNQGVSEAEVLAEFRRLIETNRLFTAVTEKVTVSDDDLPRAFEERKERLAVPERRRMRHLVVADEAQARAALARLQGGEAFVAVAKAVSLDASTRDGGGDLGVLARAELAGPFAETAFAAAVGQPFGPVKTDLGWHVGVVEEVTPGRPVTLDEVRDQLRQQLVGERRLTEWRQFLGKEISEADACYAARYRPADPDAPPPDITENLPPG